MITKKNIREINTLLKRYLPLMAILIIVFLGVTIYQLSNTNKLYKEISENCGFKKENWECVCNKFDIDFLKSQGKINYSFINSSIINNNNFSGNS
jgi:hypothetical protein